MIVDPRLAVLAHQLEDKIGTEAIEEPCCERKTCMLHAHSYILLTLVVPAVAYDGKVT